MMRFIFVSLPRKPHAGCSVQSEGVHVPHSREKKPRPWASVETPGRISLNGSISSCSSTEEGRLDFFPRDEFSPPGSWVVAADGS
jgi:hypothetical protein